MGCHERNARISFLLRASSHGKAGGGEPLDLQYFLMLAIVPIEKVPFLP